MGRDSLHRLRVLGAGSVRDPVQLAPVDLSLFNPSTLGASTCL